MSRSIRTIAPISAATSEHLSKTAQAIALSESEVAQIADKSMRSALR